MTPDQVVLVNSYNARESLRWILEEVEKSPIDKRDAEIYIKEMEELEQLLKTIKQKLDAPISTESSPGIS